MEEIRISRYPKEQIAVSQLHHLDDALDTLAFLKADDFVQDQLKKKHGKNTSEAKICAKRISSHAALASQYALLSLNSPPEISFLPGYYCILNLAKCVSLAGPYSNEFDKHSRWHGATYNTQGKASQGILTDEIKVRAGGALALFYKTLTNKNISTDKTLKLKDFYHLIPGIGSELKTVTGISIPFWCIKVFAEKQMGKIFVEAIVQGWIDGKETQHKGNVRSLPCLNGFKKKANSNGIYQNKITEIPGLSLEEHARKLIKTEFLEFTALNFPYACREQGTKLPMPDEFASSLAFFHLSSVCRYNPEFMEKLSKSKSWPMLLAMRRHSLFYFIASVWSFIIQENYILRPV